MDSHPHNLAELEGLLADEQACEEYLHRIRWPEGFRCPHCGGAEAWKTSRGLYRCRQCDAQTSLTAGTLFDGAHKPLSQWLRAMWHVVQSPPGASAAEVQRLLAPCNYRTAWTWLHKLRQVMAGRQQDRLRGIVQIDEAYVGSRRSMRRRRGRRPVLLMVGVQARRNRAGPIRIIRLRDDSQQGLLTAVREITAPGAIVRTDLCPAYAPGIELMGYRHQPFRLYPGAVGIDPLPLVAEVVGRLNVWLQQSLHGAVSPKNLDLYLAEFTFRQDAQAARFPGRAFHRLLQQAFQGDQTA